MLVRYKHFTSSLKDVIISFGMKRRFGGVLYVSKIRLKRIGAKKTPHYRVVVADSRAPRDGRAIEQIGIYNPLAKPSIVEIDEAKALDWMHKGAQPSDTVRTMFSEQGIMQKYHDAKNQK